MLVMLNSNVSHCLIREQTLYDFISFKVVKLWSMAQDMVLEFVLWTIGEKNVCSAVVEWTILKMLIKSFC